MPGLTDTKYVVCECGSKRFVVKDSFTIQKRDLGMTNDEITVKRVGDKQEAYFCAKCGERINFRPFFGTGSK